MEEMTLDQQAAVEQPEVVPGTVVMSLDQIEAIPEESHPQTEQVIEEPKDGTEAEQPERQLEPLQKVTCLCEQEEHCRFALPIGSQYTAEGLHLVVGISTRRRVQGDPASSCMGEYLGAMKEQLGSTEFERRMNSPKPADRFYHSLAKTQALAARLNAEMQERGLMVCADCAAEGKTDPVYCTHALPLVKRDDDGTWIIPGAICGRHALKRQRKGELVFSYAMSVAEAAKRNGQRSAIAATVGSLPFGNYPHKPYVYPSPGRKDNNKPPKKRRHINIG